MIDVSTYHKLSLTNKAIHRAVRIGGARYFRWKASQHLFFKLFFASSITAVSCKYGQEYTDVRNIRPDIVDVRIRLNNERMVLRKSEFEGLTRLHVYLTDNVVFCEVVDLPDGLKRFKIECVLPFERTARIVFVPITYPDSLEELCFACDVGNDVVGLYNGEWRAAPRFNTNLRYFEYTCLYASAYVFEGKKQPSELGLESVSVISRDNQFEHCDFEQITCLSNLKQLVAVDLRYEKVLDDKFPLENYPKLEHLIVSGYCNTKKYGHTTITQNIHDTYEYKGMKSKQQVFEGFYKPANVKRNKK